MSIPPFVKMKYVKNLAGSTGAKEYVNEANKHWVVKRGSKGHGGVAQVMAEATANDIYEAVGIPVPKHELEEKEDDAVLKLEFIQGPTFGQIKDKKARASIKKELQKGFIIDALLANWDVIGLNRDNILIPADGSPPVRIDNGGTFTFRASGKFKPFGPNVYELETMRDPIQAPQAAAVFGTLSDGEVHQQIMEIIQPNFHTILALTPDRLKTIMAARMDYLLSIIHAPNYGFAPNEEPFPTVTKQATDNPLLWSNWLSKLIMMLDAYMKHEKSMLLTKPNHTPSQVAALDSIVNQMPALLKVQMNFYKLSLEKGQMSSWVDLEDMQNDNTEKKSFEELYDEMSKILTKLSEEYMMYYNTYGGIESWDNILDKVGPPPDEAVNSDINVQHDYDPYDNDQNDTYHPHYQQVDPQYEKEKQQYQYQFLVTVLEAAKTSIQEALSKNPDAEQQKKLNILERQVDTTKKKLEAYDPQKKTYDMDMDLAKTLLFYINYTSKYNDLPKWNKLVPNMQDMHHVENSESGLKSRYIVEITLLCARKIQQFDDKHHISQTKKERKAIQYLIDETEAFLNLCKNDPSYCAEQYESILELYEGVVYTLIFNMIKTYDRSDKKNDVLTKNKPTHVIPEGMYEVNTKQHDHLVKMTRHLRQVDDATELKRLFNELEQPLYLHSVTFSQYSTTIYTLLETHGIVTLAKYIVMVKSMIPPYTSSSPAAMPSRLPKGVTPTMVMQVQTQIQPDPRHTVKLDKKEIETHKDIMNKHLENNALIKESGSTARKQVNETDNMLIRSYTDNGYAVVNHLLGSVGEHTYLGKSSLPYQLLRAVFPSNAGESTDDYNQRLIYYYMVNLYNAIQKGPVLHTNLYIKLYRGTGSWYLKENTDAWRYTNTFTSTSMKEEPTKKFTHGDKTFAKQYIFYVHPACRYMNISKMSRYPQEQEVLLTPYHRYLFIDKSMTYQKFLVIPTNLDIPNTYEDFMPWKTTIVDLTNQQDGGRVTNQLPFVTMDAPHFREKMTNAIHQSQLKRRKSLKNQTSQKTWKTQKNQKAKESLKTRNTLKSHKKAMRLLPHKKQSTIKASHTHKAHKRHSIKHAVTVSDGFRQRMGTPITTFPGMPLTKEEREYVDAISKIIRADKV